MRNVLGAAMKASGEMVVSIIRTIFAQPDGKHVSTQFDGDTKNSNPLDLTTRAG